jgi:hypothetical protein
MAEETNKNKFLTGGQMKKMNSNEIIQQLSIRPIQTTTSLLQISRSFYG